jgi:uncharacterized protein (TIGR02246 family)
MKASSPKDLPRLFLEGMNSGDVDSVVSLFEPDAIIAPDPGQVVAGRTAIRAMVTEFLGQRPHFVLHESDAVQAGDVALVRSRWTLTRADPGGKGTEMTVTPTLLARCQPEGRWLVVIDRPVLSTLPPK